MTPGETSPDSAKQQAATQVLTRFWPGLLTAAGGAFVILFFFHDRFWFPRDDGYYAHIASRILAGDIIHLDIQALHTGLIYFANALALKIFGPTFVSLHYPLIALGVMQAILTYLIMATRGIAPAIAASFAGASLTIVQFFNPTPHWYCIPLFFAVVIAVGQTGKTWRWQLEIVGAILMLLFMFRQLTGVFVTMGILTYLLLDTGESVRRNQWLANSIVLSMGLGLATYLANKTDMAGWLIFGIWPLLLLLRVSFMQLAGNRECLVIAARIGLGGAITIAPLVTYHFATGSIAAWISDSFVDAIALSQFSYQAAERYGFFAFSAFLQLGEPGNLAAFLNGVYWLILIFTNMALGIVTVIRLGRLPTASPAKIVLPFIGMFYGLVAVHYQDPAYLYFVAGPAVAGLLWYGTSMQRRWRAAIIVMVLYQSIIGLYFHAGQPISRSYSDALSGVRMAVVKSSNRALAGLYMTSSDLQTYESLLMLIKQETEPGDSIFAIPSNADLYFLSGRRNPLPYVYVPFGVRDDQAVANSIATLQTDLPRLVFHVPSLPYNTIHTEKIMEFVRANYDHISSHREFEIYRLRE